MFNVGDIVWINNDLTEGMTGISTEMLKQLKKQPQTIRHVYGDNQIIINNFHFYTSEITLEPNVQCLLKCLKEQCTTDNYETCKIYKHKKEQIKCLNNWTK